MVLSKAWSLMILIKLSRRPEKYVLVDNILVRMIESLFIDKGANAIFFGEVGVWLVV